MSELAVKKINIFKINCKYKSYNDRIENVIRTFM